MHAMHDPVRHDETAHAMPRSQHHATCSRMLADTTLERREHGGARPPRNMEARDAVARAARSSGAALRPADDREPAHALRVEPGALLAAREVDVRLGPPARPVIVGAV